MNRYAFKGLTGAKSPSKIQRDNTFKGVKCYERECVRRKMDSTDKGVKCYKREGVRRKMDSVQKTAKSSRGYEMIHTLIERGLRINSTK